VYRPLRDTYNGYFASDSWTRKGGKDPLDEINLNALLLKESALAVFTVLLHEAVHSSNRAQGISDCSKSQYHNRHFRDRAEEMGLNVERLGSHGWAATPSLQAGALLRYAGTIARLGRALVAFNAAARGGRGEKQATRLLKATCECGRVIRVSAKTFEDGLIICTKCGNPFEIAEN
jgi:hypothetical protein